MLPRFANGALMFTVMQIMLTGLAYFWSRARVRMPIIRM